MTAKMSSKGKGRRAFVKKAAYIAPAILTLAAAPEFAKAGSDKFHRPGSGNNPGLPVEPPTPG